MFALTHIWYHGYECNEWRLHMRPLASTVERTDIPGKAKPDRLLKQMQQVCSHDLPNPASWCCKAC